MIAVALFLIAQALPAQALPAPDAVQWEVLLSDSEGRILIDPASITRNGDVVQVNARVDLSPAAGTGRRIFIIRFADDCRRHTLAMLAGDTYGESGVQTGSRRVLPNEVAEELIDPEMTALMEARVCAVTGN